MRRFTQTCGLTFANHPNRANYVILRRVIYPCTCSSTLFCSSHASTAAAADNDVNSTFTWNSMIRGCTQSLHLKDALLFYRRMIRQSGVPDSFTFSFILSACATTKQLKPGRVMHGQVLKLGFVSDVFVMNNLLQLYVNCEGAEVALKVFVEIPQPDVVSYNTLIHGCFAEGFVERSRQLFEEMPTRNLISWSTVLNGYKQLGCHVEVLALFSDLLKIGQPDAYIVAIALSACASMCSLESGRQIHCHVIKFEHLAFDAFVLNGIVHMYANCGSIHVACIIFDGLLHRHAVSWNALIAGYVRLGFLEKAERLLNEMPDKDVISWSALISACLQAGFYQEALMVYREMRTTSIRPNEITIASVLSSCTRLMEVLEGEKIHAYVIKCGLEDDKLHNSLVHFYSGCGLMDKALRLFKENETVVGCCSLVVGFCRCGSVDHARRLFNRMTERDLVSWNAMVFGYSQSRRLKEAFELFAEMQMTEAEPDDATLLSLMVGCADFAALRQGESLHAYMHKKGIELKCSLGAAVVDMYARCGSMDTAFGIFHGMKTKSSSAWNALIRGLALNGCEKEALNVFTEMQQLQVAPDSFTFLALLTACRHAGWLDAAWHFFNCMRTVHRIKPSLAHYGCMVVLLGQAGNLIEAEELILNMPMKPAISTWGALLFACRSHRNVEVGERIVQQILELDPGNTDCQLLLANIYAEAGKWERAVNVRKRMKELRGGQRTPGSSSIHVVDDGRF
ncbi:pentatricopeptide repeat-containing protein At5g19020, mitochondrial-like [Nymphaea colorata]|nr:pentatricopeptide repeat-containing protein At5g19020, mitochondrial-like [Nymphaea colorata]XP_031478715.1 pentatricopeptide repeat-containing protein At5g19020, mitochondrial-like [Nymphaea colorata]